tara:strand:- start:190 stop:405 length:216 start_codon:yes stop_codon:yes gene_type:complete
MAVDLKLWENLTETEKDSYRRQYIADMVYNTGCSESAAAFRFDVSFDCCAYNESVYMRRDIALITRPTIRQ